MSETADRVKKIVVEHLGVEPDKVTEDASFIDDLGADSLDIVELVMAFEEEFGVEIPDDAAEKITTVQRRDRLYRPEQGLSRVCRPAAELRSKGGYERLPEPYREAVCFGGTDGVETDAPCRRDRSGSGDAAGRRRRDELEEHPRRRRAAPGRSPSSTPATRNAASPAR